MDYERGNRATAEPIAARFFVRHEWVAIACGRLDVCFGLVLDCSIPVALHVMMSLPLALLSLLAFLFGFV